ncbi:hypothetical protein FDP41_003231 [Naegleria fowleri]|uniref:Endonuclease/exonuclease/phosphatase domain-containing protein n=1 Tax=Naegleria fowleri TaxID=5763 RepID=A0A6A5BY81_NAEFO|nr:uncharacterized protein FDP41_003231 [Naegleria fowleri]KAF0977909.1 hypothetical protein FDP41_003231 [Naegleria fowleri]CAG4717058.1 unnamed protein product [Naegleria fowleri]
MTSFNQNSHHHHYSGYPRQWLSSCLSPSPQSTPHSESSSSKTRTTSSPISILSYNLLAQSLCNRRGTQSYLTPEQARWSFRKNKLLNEIAYLNMDIISLQEVDFYDSFWEMELQKLGYSTLYSPQFNFEKNHRPMPYGLVIGYKKDKFHLLKSKVVDYRLQSLELMTPRTNEHLDPHNNNLHTTTIGENSCNPHDPINMNGATCLPPMTILEQCEMNQSGNITLLAVLQCVANESTKDRRGIILSNTHLYWRPESNAVRVRQELILLHEMNELFKEFNDSSENVFELVLTGDFNTSPNDLPYILLTTRNPQYGCGGDNDENGIALDENGKKFWDAFNQSERMASGSSSDEMYDIEKDPLVPYFPIVEWATEKCKEEFIQRDRFSFTQQPVDSSSQVVLPPIDTLNETLFERYYFDQQVKRLENIRQCVNHIHLHYPLLHSVYTEYSNCTFTSNEEEDKLHTTTTTLTKSTNGTFSSTLSMQKHIEEMKVHSRWSNHELYYTTFTPKFISSLDYIMVRKQALKKLKGFSGDDGEHDALLPSCSSSLFRKTIQLCALLSIPTPHEIHQGQEEQSPLHHGHHHPPHTPGISNLSVASIETSRDNLEHTHETSKVHLQETNVKLSKQQHFIPNSIHASDHFSLAVRLAFVE